MNPDPGFLKTLYIILSFLGQKAFLPASDFFIFGKPGSDFFSKRICILQGSDILYLCFFSAVSTPEIENYRA